MSLALKEGVRLLGLKPEMCVAMMVAGMVWAERGKLLTITSCTDGRHGKGSLHYKGLAFDCRTSDLTEEERQQVVGALKMRLRSDFDVILESTHIHIEFDPKEPMGG